MSGLVAGLCWKHSTFRGAPLMVLVAMADNAHDDGVAHPGTRYLTNKTRCSRSTVLAALKALVASGELQVMQKPGGHKTTTHRINVEQLQSQPSVLPDYSDEALEVRSPDIEVRSPDAADSESESSDDPEVRSANAEVRSPALKRQETSTAVEKERSYDLPKKTATDRVWAHYVEVMKPRQRRLDAGGRAVITAALLDASEDECKGAIDGCAASAFHMGQNEHRRKYNRLTQILKGRTVGPSPRTTRETIDFFLDKRLGPGRRSSATPDEVSRNKRAVLDAHSMPGNVHVAERGKESRAWLREQEGIEWDVESRRWVPVTDE